MALKPTILKENQLNPPNRIIRTCCSFGVDLQMGGFPFVKFTDITSLEKIGPHTFLGNNLEQNGIIYTLKGGFIDLGHLRDQADWTAWLYELIQNSKETEGVQLKLGNEGGLKKLNLCIPKNIDDQEAMELAGKIAYDLSVWHEIGTWNGTSYIPLVPERYSAFSVEDAYSNLLGTKLGILALKSPLPYEEAMTQLINEKLVELKAVNSLEETYQAMNSVKNIWWTDDAKLPSAKVLLMRQFDVYGCIKPLLVPMFNIYSGEELCQNENSIKGTDLNKYYELSIRLNYKFPVKKIFNSENPERIITQKDFILLIDEARKENDLRLKSIKTF